MDVADAFGALTGIRTLPIGLLCVERFREIKLTKFKCGYPGEKQKK